MAGIALAVFVLWAAPAAAQTVTVRGIELDCAFVRSLTWIERRFYVIRYAITRIEQRQIKQTCGL